MNTETTSSRIAWRVAACLANRDRKSRRGRRPTPPRSACAACRNNSRTRRRARAARPLHHAVETVLVDEMIVVAVDLAGAGFACRHRDRELQIPVRARATPGQSSICRRLRVRKRPAESRAVAMSVLRHPLFDVLDLLAQLLDCRFKPESDPASRRGPPTWRTACWPRGSVPGTGNRSAGRSRRRRRADRARR